MEAAVNGMARSMPRAVAGTAACCAAASSAVCVVFRFDSDVKNGSRSSAGAPTLALLSRPPGEAVPSLGGSGGHSC